MHNEKTVGLFKASPLMPRSRHRGGQPLVSATSRRMSCQLFCGDFLQLSLSASVPALLFFHIDPGGSGGGVQGEGMRVCLVAQKLQDEGMRLGMIVTPSSRHHGNYGGINTNIFAVFQHKRCHLMWHRSVSVGLNLTLNTMLLRNKISGSRCNCSVCLLICIVLVMLIKAFNYFFGYLQRY